MRKTKSKEISKKIVCDYAVWHVQSAFRRGPVRSRLGAQEMLSVVDFSTVLDSSKGPITAAEFAAWHEASTEAILATNRMANEYGWAAKALNIYLKTTTYIGGIGRQGLITHLHPPIDSGIWDGLLQRFGGHPALAATHQVQSINGIRTADTYAAIINGMRQLAQTDNCLLIELEQYWLDGL